MSDNDIEMKMDETYVSKPGEQTSNVGKETLAIPSTRAQDQQKPNTAAPPQPEVNKNSTLLATQAQLLEANKKLATAESDREELRKEITTLTTVLHETQNFIFSLQPRQQKLTESEALEEYTTLCESIGSWVEFHLGDAIEEKTLLKQKHYNSGAATQLLNLLNPSGREGFRIEGTDEYNVIAAVMQFLREKLFDREFYCPLARGAMDFLTSIEKSMRNLEPQRDLATCRTWRSETLTAVTNRPIFEKNLTDYKQHLTRSLARILHIFIPGTNINDLQISIHKTIIEPACNLAHKFHLSVDVFSLAWTPYSRMRPEYRARQAIEFEKFECADLGANGKVIRFPSLNRQREKEKEKEKEERLSYLLDIFPALLFQGVKCDVLSEVKLLRKSKVLIVVKKMGGDEGNVDMEGYDNGEGTLLGIVYEQLSKGRGIVSVKR